MDAKRFYLNTTFFCYAILHISFVELMHEVMSSLEYEKIKQDACACAQHCFDRLERKTKGAQKQLLTDRVMVIIRRKRVLAGQIPERVGAWREDSTKEILRLDSELTLILGEWKKKDDQIKAGR